jgi:hypothetical protein
VRGVGEACLDQPPEAGADVHEEEGEEHDFGEPRDVRRDFEPVGDSLKNFHRLILKKSQTIE